MKSARAVGGERREGGRGPRSGTSDRGLVGRAEVNLQRITETRQGEDGEREDVTAEVWRPDGLCDCLVAVFCGEPGRMISAGQSFFPSQPA